MKFLRIQKLCFNSFGFSFNPNESILIRFFALLNWALLLGISIPEAHFAVENSSSVELVTDTLATLLTCILTLTKVMRMFFNSSKLYEIVLELEVMWLKGFFVQISVFFLLNSQTKFLYLKKKKISISIQRR